MQTDKFRTGLAQVYAEMFADLRHEPVSVLEIGIKRGGSLRLWAEFFDHQNSRIIGVDLKIPEGEFPDNVTMYQCNQNDTSGLLQIAAEHGPFDIIIDDGCHFARETGNCFQLLFSPSLKIDGYYVIEDWAVGYRSEARYAGMVELVTGIIRHAPQLAISALTMSLKPAQAYVVFRKAERGWRA